MRCAEIRTAAACPRGRLVVDYFFFQIQTVEGVTRLLRFCLRPVITETLAGLAVLHREPVIANRADRKTRFGHVSDFVFDAFEVRACLED